MPCVVGPGSRVPIASRCGWDGNPRARSFYERVGFSPTGQRQPLPSAPEIGEELLQRRVAS